VTSTRTATTARHRAATSRLRRVSEIVLVVGTVVALLSLLGPVWATRVGVVVAVAAAVTATVCAWRELFAVERRHARTLLQTSQRHGAQLREERQHNAGVVDALTERVRAVTRVVEGQQVTIAALRHEIFALEGDRTTLRGRLADRDRTVTSLRTTVQKQDVELTGLRERAAELRAQAEGLQAHLASLREDAAGVHHLPRRVRAELEAVAAGADSDVLDLRTLETVRGIRPNNEGERRFG
jgi:chromosome segregation ATPase